MEITQVKVYPVQEDKLKAFVSIVFDHCFMVNDIKVIQGKDGLFLSMPSRRKKSGEFKDVAHPLNNETRRMLEERVLEEYQLEVGDASAQRMHQENHDASDEPSSASSPGQAPIETVSPTTVRAPSLSPPPVAAVAPAMAASGGGSAGATEKTLEEVQEMHLQDSFWSVS